MLISKKIKTNPLYFIIHHCYSKASGICSNFPFMKKLISFSNEIALLDNTKYVLRRMLGAITELVIVFKR